MEKLSEAQERGMDIARRGGELVRYGKSSMWTEPDPDTKSIDLKMAPRAMEMNGGRRWTEMPVEHVQTSTVESLARKGLLEETERDEDGYVVRYRVKG